MKHIKLNYFEHSQTIQTTIYGLDHSRGHSERFSFSNRNVNLFSQGRSIKVQEAKKVRLLLLWIDDKGLEIYNTTAWASDGDNLKIDPVMVAL